MEDRNDLSTIVTNIVPSHSTNLHEKSRKRLEFFYREAHAKQSSHTLFCFSSALSLGEACSQFPHRIPDGPARSRL